MERNFRADPWDRVWAKEGIDVCQSSLTQVMARDSYYRLYRFLIQKAGVFRGPAKRRALEAGCGSGLRALALTQEEKKRIQSCVLLDFSPEALRLSKEMAGKNGLLRNNGGGALSFARADLFGMPFPENTFDIIWNEGVMEHFDGAGRQRGFDLIYRILRPGGFFICIVPNRLNLPFMLYKRLRVRRGRWEYGFQREFTVQELKSRFVKAGFEVTAVGGIDCCRPIKGLLKELGEENRPTPQNDPVPPANPSGEKFGLHFRRTKEKFWKWEMKFGFGQWLGADIGVCGKKG